MIAEENVVITITHSGYIKRTAEATYRSQRRGGRGLQGAGTKEEDFVEDLFVANTHDYLLFFTDKGKCYWLKVHEIPPGGRAARGRAVVNLIGCEPGEKVEAFVGVNEFDDHRFIVMATEKGVVKKTKLAAYGNPRKGGIYAIEIRDGDRLIEDETYYTPYAIFQINTFASKQRLKISHSLEAHREIYHKTFIVAIFPRTSRLYIKCLYSNI